MDHYWVISIENTAGGTLYVQRLRPNRYTAVLSAAKRFDDVSVKRASNWLVDIGVSHSLQVFTNV